MTLQYRKPKHLRDKILIDFVTKSPKVEYASQYPIVEGNSSYYAPLNERTSEPRDV
jgi:uncharacterized protein YecE (DUF72 family)